MITSKQSPSSTESSLPAPAPSRLAQLWPGLAAASLAAVLAVLANRLVPPLSALLVAILLGVAARNFGMLRPRLDPGLARASKRWLRLGIVLLGFQLVLTEVARLGWGVLVTVVAVVVVGIVTAVVVGRLLGVPPTLRLLVGCGFSICGAAAVAGMDGAVEAEEEDVATAVALVVLFGTAMIFIAPPLSGVLGLTGSDAGEWMGASIHEVAQVVAAGGIAGGDVVHSAVAVKLARVLMLAPVIAGVGLLAPRLGVRRAGEGEMKRPPLVPLFVLGFLAASVVATTGWMPGPALAWIKVAQTFLLAAAMFGLGCGVKVAALRKVGSAPFLLGAVVTVVVALTAYLGVVLG